ncbi:hypothetical protein HDU93_008453 [Gonapodya sp. JEL0774]|nr:hypothetical protein HDU93_008453 [Gonapodya sp. JEL0774]
MTLSFDDPSWNPGDSVPFTSGQNIQIMSILTALRSLGPKQILALFAHGAACPDCKRAYGRVITLLGDGPKKLQRDAPNIKVMTELRTLQIICLLVSSPIVHTYLEEFSRGASGARKLLESGGSQQEIFKNLRLVEQGFVPLHYLLVVKPALFGRALCRTPEYWPAVLNTLRVTSDPQ